MRTVSIRLEDLAKGELFVGYVGENFHTRVIIDAAKMYAQYPSAAAALTVRPPRAEAYPAVVTREGDCVLWDVTDSDLTQQGNGEIQLAFTVDDVIAKTYIGRIRIGRSIIRVRQFMGWIRNQCERSDRQDLYQTDHVCKLDFVLGEYS